MIRPIFIFLLASLSLTACSTEPEKVPLKGERLSILDLDDELKPDAKINPAEIITLPAAKNYAEWPQAGGYPHHVMENLALGNGQKIELIWKSDIGAGSSKDLPLTARPVIAEGKVFTMDSQSVVKAFHNQTGKPIWEANVQHPEEDDYVITGGIAYADGMIFVTSGYNEVLALNSQNGEITWRKKISASSRAAPTAYKGRVFITGMNNNVMALEAATGKAIWEYEGVEAVTGLLGAASPAADGDMVVAALSTGDLVAFNAENGGVLWQDNLSNNTLRYGGGMTSLSDIRGLPIIAGDIVLAVSYSGKMNAISRNSGQLLWQQKIASAETPYVVGNTVYVITTDYKIVALNLPDGAVLWISDLPKYQDAESREGLINWAGPVMGNGILMMVGSDGRMAEFDPKVGKLLKQWKTDSNISLPPVLAGGTLFAVSGDGTLLAYR